MYTQLVLPVIFLLLQICHCQKNEVTLYDQPDQQGNSITISMSSNLAWNDFDNKAVSVCVSGLMLFYTDTDFEGYMENVYGGNNHCKNLTYAGKISSIRYPGYLEDVKKDSITLYENEFGGMDYREYGDAFNRELVPIISLIITGGSNWTIFDSNNFQGRSACLIVPDPINKTPCFLPRVQDIPNFGYGIYSGIKGCNDTTISKVYLVPFSKPSKSISTTEKPIQQKSNTEDLNDVAIIDPLLRFLSSYNIFSAKKHSENGTYTIIILNDATTYSIGGLKVPSNLVAILILLWTVVIILCVISLLFFITGCFMRQKNMKYHQKNQSDKSKSFMYCNKDISRQ